MKKHLGVVAAVMALASAAGAATVTVVGEATGTYRPDVVRVTVALTAGGADAAAAVTALAAKREAIKKALTGAGATTATATPATAGGPPLSAQQRQIQAMMGRRMGAKPAASQPAVVTMSTVVTADCPLPGGADDDAAVVAAVGVQEKVRAAVTAAVAASAKGTPPAEQEAVDEQDATPQMPMGMAAAMAKPGEPQFTFVHKMTADERAKLTAQAMAAAQADAARVQAAAKLGDHLAVQEVTTKTASADADSPFAAIIRAESGQAAAPTGAEDEAVDAQPGSASFTVHLTVRYGS